MTCVLTSNAFCTTSPTASSNTIIVNVTAPVTPTVTVAASENNVCAGTAITFTATPVNGGSAPAYQWLINGNPTSGNSNTLVRSNLNNNDVISCRLTSNIHCAIANVPSNNVSMLINPLPVVNSGGDKTIERGSSVQIGAIATGGIADITWSPSAGLSNSNILKPMATPDNTTTYTVTVRSTDGCTNTATVTVTVLISVVPPNTFTLNNDGINDKWEIKNLAEYPNADLKIYTRWGAQVYRSNGSVNAWDGTFNGKLLPVGTYYYIITLSKGAQPISGYVALLR